MNEKVRSAAERSYNLPSWLSLPSNPSKEVTQSGKRSENMRAFYSETSRSFRYDPEMIPHPFGNTKQQQSFDPSINPSRLEKKFSNDSKSSVFSIDYPRDHVQTAECSDSSSSRTSSRKSLVRGKRS